MSQNQSNNRAQYRRLTLLCIVALFILLVLVLAILLIANIVNSIRDGKPDTPADDNPGDEQPEDPTDEHPDDGKDDPGKDDPPAPETVTVELSSADVNRGYLQLVNTKNAYAFTESEGRLVYIYNQLGKMVDVNYRLNNINLRMEKTAFQALDKMLTKFKEVSGKDDVLIESAYRSFEDQQNSGSSTPAGYSDTHLGLSCSLRVMPRDTGKRIYLSSSETYAWITEHCYEYGFTVRYPLDKVAMTGVDDYEYYFRYVGYIHAYLMKQNNMCLEEYITYLHGHTNDNPVNVTGDNGISYRIYYVPAAALTTKVPVPAETEGSYTVSGDNVSGYVVTVTLTAQENAES